MIGLDWVSAESFFPPLSSPPRSSAAFEPSAVTAPDLGSNDRQEQAKDEMGVDYRTEEGMPPPPPSKMTQPQQQQSLPEIINMLNQHLINLIVSSPLIQSNALPLPKHVIWKDLFIGQVLFIDGHVTAVERYMSALFLHAGGFIAVALDEQLVQYVILGPAVEEDVRRRIALMPNVQHGNLIWLMDLLLPRETWRHLLPSPYNNDGAIKGGSVAMEEDMGS